MTKLFIKSIMILGFVGFLLLHQSCERGIVDDTNPFENNTNNQDTVNFTIVDIDFRHALLTAVMSSSTDLSSCHMQK